MLGFRRQRHHRGAEGSSSQPAYRYRIHSRQTLLDKYQLVALRPDQKLDERARLERVLEEVAAEGWRLVGVSGDDFIFRRRA